MVLGWSTPRSGRHRRLLVVPQGTLLLGRSHRLSPSQQCPLGSDHGVKSRQGPWGWQPKGEGAAHGEGASWLCVSGAAGAPVTQRSWCCAPATCFCWAPWGPHPLCTSGRVVLEGSLTPRCTRSCCSTPRDTTGARAGAFRPGGLWFGSNPWSNPDRSGLGSAPGSCRLLSSPCPAERPAPAGSRPSPRPRQALQPLRMPSAGTWSCRAGFLMGHPGQLCLKHSFLRKAARRTQPRVPPR